MIRYYLDTGDWHALVAAGWAIVIGSVAAIVAYRRERTRGGVNGHE